MTVPNSDFLAIFNEGAGTNIPDETGNITTTIGQGVEDTDWSWNQDVGNLDGYLASLNGAGNSMFWASHGNGLGSNVAQPRSFAFGFRVDSYDTRASSRGFLHWAAAATGGGVTLRAQDPSSTGDYNLLIEIHTTSGAGPSYTITDLNFGEDYFVVGAWDCGNTGGWRVRAVGTNTTNGSGTVDNSGTLFDAGGTQYFGRSGDFANYYGFTGRLYYYSEWYNHYMSEVDADAINSDPKANITSWPAGAGDTTAPVFEAGPSAANIAGTTLDINATIDEGGTIYSVVLADGATAPNSAEVKAGTGSGGAAAVDSGSAAATASTQATISHTGLSDETAYDVYVVAEDDEATPNIQSSPTLVEVTTADETPPAFEVAPAVENVVDTQLDAIATLNEDGTLYAVVVADTAAAPSSAQVKAGQDSTGSPAISSGSTAATASTQASITLTGLTANTPYDVYVVAEDDEASPNLQASPTKVDATTTPAAQIAFSSLKDQDGQLVPDATTINYQWWPDSAGTGTQDFDNLNATVESGSQATSGAGSLTLTGLTTGGGLLALQWTRASDSKIHRHAGRYTVA